MNNLRILTASFLCMSVFICKSAIAQNNTGLEFLDEAQYKSVPLAATPLLGDLPTEVDLSSYFPRPGNQGRQSSCVGWAISYLKSYQEKVERKWDLNTDDHVFSPSYIYNQIKTAPGCGGGSNFSDALNLIRKTGHATLRDFPYDETQCTRIPNSFTNQSARQYAIADWRRVNAQDETEIKTQISAGFPVLIGMMVDEKFSQLAAGDTYAGPPGRGRSGHAMVVVGYSEDRKTFKVINSWGESWGDGGFGEISFQAFRANVREAFVVQDIVTNKPPAPAPIIVSSPPNTPAPAVAQPQVSIGTPNFAHNMMVSSPTGLQPGMQIRIPGTIRNASGRSLQLIVKFNYLNGPPLRANPTEALFRDAGGLVATSTAPIPVATNSEILDNIIIGMPYYALNMAPSGGFNNYTLSMTVSAVVDNQLMAQSTQIPFPFRW